MIGPVRKSYVLPGLGAPGPKNGSWSAGVVYSSIVSTLALAISGATAYYTYFRPPSVHFLVGPNIFVEYEKQSNGDNLVVTLPIVMSNSGAEPSSVTDTNIIVEASNGQTITLSPLRYVKLVDGKFQYSDSPLPEVINGGGNIKRLIQYISPYDWLTHFQHLVVGRYDLSFSASLDMYEKPTRRISFIVQTDEGSISSLTKEPTKPVQLDIIRK
jgi:hypothetical protein